MTSADLRLFGLLGEAGEVLNEVTDFSGVDNGSEYSDDLHTIWEGIKSANAIDSLKKRIRDKEKEPIQVHINDEEKFDSEMGDVIYYLNALAINRGKTLNDYAEISYQKVMKYKQQKDIRHANIEHGVK